MSTIHEINGEKLLNPLEVPDGQEQAYVDAYVALKQKQSPTSSNFKDFGNKVKGVVGGAAKAVGGGLNNLAVGLERGWTGGAKADSSEQVNTPDMLHILQGMPPDAQEKVKASIGQHVREVNAPSQGVMQKTGEIGADVLKTAPLMYAGGAGAAALAPEAGGLVASILSGLGMGTGSAATHQIQNVANGKGVKPGDALEEMLLSSVFGAGGYELGQGLKQVAPGLLEHAVSPSKTLMKQINPPSSEGYKLALEKDLVPAQVGFKGAAKPMGEALSDMNEVRGNLADQSGQMVNLSAATRSSKGGITSGLGTMQGGLSNTDAAGAGKFFDEQMQTIAQHNPNARILVTRDQFGPKSATGTQVRLAQKGDMLAVKDAAKQGIKGDLVVPAKDAIKIKSGLGQQTNWKDALESEKGRSLAAQTNYGSIKNQYQSRIGKTPEGPEFAKVDEEMASLTPISEAIKDRGYSNRLMLPFFHGLGSPAAILTGHTPLPAVLAQRGGKSLTNSSTGRNLVAQAIRSGIFGGDK